MKVSFTHTHTHPPKSVTMFSVPSRNSVRRVVVRPRQEADVQPQQEAQRFPRPYTLNRKQNNSILTLNNRPPNTRKTVTPDDEPFHETSFESTIPVFQSVDNTVAFRDHVLRRIDLNACDWVVSRNHNDDEAIYSTFTKLRSTYNRIVSGAAPVPFHFQGSEVIEKLIVHSVAILIVDEIRFSPERNRLDIDGRLWVPPTNVALDMNVLTTMYNDLLYGGSDYNNCL